MHGAANRQVTRCVFQGSQRSMDKYHQRAALYKDACQQVKSSFNALVGFAVNEDGELFLPALKRSCEGVRVGVDPQSRGVVLSPDDRWDDDRTAWSDQTWTCRSQWSDHADRWDDDRSTWCDET